MSNGKRCPDCGIEFPATAEHFHARRGDKLNTYCKRCASARAKAHHAANRDNKLALMTVYRDAHRDELREYYRNRDKAKKSESDKSYRARNSEAIRKKSKEHYERNKQSFIDRARRWARLNPVKARLHHQAQSHKRRGVAPDNTAIEYMHILSSDPGCVCGGVSDKMEIDHIVPISSGGTGDWNNLTSACRKCNGAKSAKSLLSFLLERA